MESTSPPRISTLGRGLRDWLALSITVFSVLSVLLLSSVAIVSSTGEAINILSAVLPLLGSWVGTVLAYYFSKENFESASRSMSDMVDKVTQKELKSIPVAEKMITVDKIFHKTKSDFQQKLFDLLDTFDKSSEIWSRLPILSDDKKIESLIHRRTVEKFLGKKYRSPDETKKMEEWTIEDILGDIEFSTQDKYGFIPRKSTLADANEVMSRIQCKDVFVTENGKSDEPIVGWITNAILIENAKL